MKPNHLHNPLVVLVPCRVKVPHVKHLVVLAHIQNSMTTSVLRSSEGHRSRPLGTKVSAARWCPYGGEASIPVQDPNKGNPPWERRERAEDRRKPISIRESN